MITRIDDTEERQIQKRLLESCGVITADDALAAMVEEYEKLKKNFEELKLQNPSYTNYYDSELAKFTKVINAAKKSPGFEYLDNLKQAIDEAKETDTVKKTPHKTKKLFGLAIGIGLMVAGVVLIGLAGPLGIGLGVGLIIAGVGLVTTALACYALTQRHPFIKSADNFYKQANLVNKQGRIGDAIPEREGCLSRILHCFRK